MEYLNEKNLQLLICLSNSDGLSISEIDCWHNFRAFFDEISHLKIIDNIEIIHLPDEIHVPWSDALRFCEEDTANDPHSLYMFFVQIKNKKKMHDFLWMYATRFEHGKLVSPNNFYSYKKHLEFYLKEWGGLFDKFGSNISIAQGPSKNRSIWDENKNFRLYEFILSLQNKGHITINKCYLEDYGAYGGYDYESGRTFPTIKDTALKLNIKFKKRPLEIGRLENSFSIHYGDLKINERGKIAYYKNHKFCAIQARNNSFKVLCYLASQPDTNISILKIYREFEPKSKVRELSLKKKKVKGWIKEIKEALKITQDKNRTIDISIVGDDVLLTQDTR